MSTHNICFRQEIRKISAFLDEKGALSVAMLSISTFCVCINKLIDLELATNN